MSSRSRLEGGSFRAQKDSRGRKRQRDVGFLLRHCAAAYTSHLESDIRGEQERNPEDQGDGYFQD